MDTKLGFGLESSNVGNKSQNNEINKEQSINESWIDSQDSKNVQFGKTEDTLSSEKLSKNDSPNPEPTSTIDKTDSLNENNQVSSREGIPDQESNNDQIDENIQSYSQMPTQTESIKVPKKKNLLLLVLLVIFVVLLFGAGGAFAYYYYLISPEQVMSAMFAKVQNVKTYQYTGSIKTQLNYAIPTGISTNQSNKDQINLASTDNELSNTDFDENGTTPEINQSYEITFDGSVDVTDSANLLSSMNLKFGIADERSPFELKLKLITIGKLYYLNLENITDFGLIDLDSIIGQWVSLDFQEIKKETGLDKLEEELNKEMGVDESKKELTREEQEELVKLVKDNQIIKITDKLASEKVNGKNSHHYAFQIDKNGLKQIVVWLYKKFYTSEITNDEMSDLESQLGYLSSLDGEIWIGKLDMMPYKIVVNLIPNTQSQSLSTSKSVFTIGFSDYNKSVNISAPKSSKSWKEVWSELSAGWGISDIADTTKDTDEDGLTDELEELYETDINNVDTDGDGYKDGEEVENGYNPKGDGRLEAVNTTN